MSAPYLNQCGACGEDFTGVTLFDAHRVGKHAYTFAEGARMDPPREDGRRCLAVAEMEERGWKRNARGRWSDGNAVRPWETFASRRRENGLTGLA